MEYLRSFKLYSSYAVEYLHVTHDVEIDLDLNDFDAILHSYCARLCFSGYVSSNYLNALKRFRGVKILAIQDEYDRTDIARQAICDLRFDVVLTCVPQESVDFVYPREMLPDTEFVTVLTGYVPSWLSERLRPSMPLAQRPITIGYRGRELPAYYGRLGQDKIEIGRRMREICISRGIRHDIEISEDSRIYGDAWYEFLGNCRVTLGTESGSNVFDFDGSLQKSYETLRKKRGIGPSYEEFRRYTDRLEDNISMGQVSPRLFEAAAVGTPMVLFSGRYSGIVVPGKHYIELRKDFSNIDSVLEQVEDIGSLTAIAERAYRDLIKSGRYDYRHFVEMVDGIIDRKLAEKGCTEARPRSGVLLPPDDLWRPTRKERPTAMPRDVHVFLYRIAYFEREELLKEIARLQARHLPALKLSVHLKRWLIDNTPRLATALRRLKARWRAALSRQELD